MMRLLAALIVSIGGVRTQISSPPNPGFASCDVCKGLMMGDPNIVLSFANQPNLTCSQMNTAGMSGFFSETECQELQSLLHDVCGCTVDAATVPPSAAPTMDICDDDPAAEFPTMKGQTEPCRWLAARAEQQEIYCVPGHPSGAFDLCEETCRKCTDSCVDDDDASFSVDGKIRNCLWLSLRSKKQEELCVEGTTPWEMCKESCNNCNQFFVLKENNSTADPLFDPCNICGANSTITNATALLHFPVQSPVTCAQFARLGFEGFVDPASCPQLPFSVGDLCGCTSLVYDTCEICGESSVVTKPDTVLDFPGQPSFTCSEFADFGLSGLIDSTTCSDLPSIIGEACGCISA